MDYKVSLTDNAQKDLAKLPHLVVKRVINKLRLFSMLSDPLAPAKKLKGFVHATYRYRVGDYRIVFRLDKQTNTVVLLLVLRIAHRKEVYQNLN